MSISWQSLYLRCDNTSSTIADQLRQSVVKLGYELFDPFALIPGKSYPQAVRTFVAPTLEGWTRVISENTIDERALSWLSQVDNFALAVSLVDADADLIAYQNGIRMALPDALMTHLRAGKTLDDLRSAYAAVTVLPAPDQSNALRLDVLPDEVRQLAEQVDMQKAQGMFARLSGDLLKKAGGTGATIPQGADWNSAGGARIRAVMACLTIPEMWHEPDFVALRDAYQLHLRRQRLPNARLYPGDAEAMEHVPDALSYMPVYGGKF